MFGSVGILPALGVIGSSFASGGTSGLGFTMMSGLLNTMIRPKDAVSTFGGMMGPSYFGPFGNLEGGPNVASVGSLAGYLGQSYAATGFPVASPTIAGQYFGNAGYNFANSGVSYGSGNAAPGDYRAGVSQLQFGGDLGSYQQSFSSMNTVFPETATAASYNTFGSAMGPYSQNFGPMLTPYSSGYPQMYNPAASLMGYQSGAFTSPNQTPPPPYFNINAGGPSLAAAITGDSGGDAKGSESSAAGLE